MENNLEDLIKENKELKIALEKSLTLQRHYAKLLNSYDGGERIVFNSAEEWLARLRKLGKLDK